MIRRLALVVGDTAGHVNPALAIAEAYRARFENVSALFLAAPDGPASQLVRAAGYEVALVPGLPLARTGPLGKLIALSHVGPCIAVARRALLTHGARVVIGSGGYASGGVVLAARILRLRTAVVEPNVEPGLANRLLRRFAARAYCTYPETARTFPAGRGLVTGTPVRRSLAASLLARRQPALQPSEGPVKVLVTSGSRGDEFLASHVPALLARLRDRGIDLEVIHQAMALDHDRIRRAYADLGLRGSVEPRLESLAHAYEWATLAIARAGASTLAELALAGLPALLVPLGDAAEDHQSANAMRYAEAGAALWTREGDWHIEQLTERLHSVLREPAALQQVSDAARQWARPEAADKIVDDCETSMMGRW